MTNTKNYLTSVIVVLVITLLLSIDSCAANVRGYHGVRPLVKNGGAVNPHLSNIEVRGANGGNSLNASEFLR